MEEEEAAAHTGPCPASRTQVEDMHCQPDKVAAVQDIARDTVAAGDRQAAALDRAAAQDRAAAAPDKEAAALGMEVAALGTEVAAVDTGAAVQDIAADIALGRRDTEGVVLKE